MLVALPQLTPNNNTTQQEGPQPTVTAHEQTWYSDDVAIKLPIKGNYHYRTWAIKVRNGECIGKGGDPQQTHSHLEYFIMLFPPSQLNLIANLMNGELAKNQKNYTTTGKIIKFFGVMILVMRIEFVPCGATYQQTSTLV